MISICLRMIVLFAFIILDVVYANSQESLEQTDVINLEELMNGHVHKVDELLYSNLSFIHQIGDENIVSSIQQQKGSNANSIKVEQLKKRNIAYIKQRGSGHTTSLFQNGYSSEVNLELIGKNICTTVFQQGDENSINSYIENLENISFSATFLQKGNNNNIKLGVMVGELKESVDQYINIEQYGNHHQAEAIFEPFSAPVEIIQTPGIGGEGMSISISNSAFGFPMK